MRRVSRSAPVAHWAPKLQRRRAPLPVDARARVECAARRHIKFLQLLFFASNSPLRWIPSFCFSSNDNVECVSFVSLLFFLFRSVNWWLEMGAALKCAPRFISSSAPFLSLSWKCLSWARRSVKGLKSAMEGPSLCKRFFLFSFFFCGVQFSRKTSKQEEEEEE